jgi:transposase-like protein
VGSNRYKIARFRTPQARESKYRALCDKYEKLLNDYTLLKWKHDRYRGTISTLLGLRFELPPKLLAIVDALAQVEGTQLHGHRFSDEYKETVVVEYLNAPAGLKHAVCRRYGHAYQTLDRWADAYCASKGLPPRPRLPKGWPRGRRRIHGVVHDTIEPSEIKIELPELPVPSAVPPSDSDDFL